MKSLRSPSMALVLALVACSAAQAQRTAAPASTPAPASTLGSTPASAPTPAPAPASVAVAAPVAAPVTAPISATQPQLTISPDGAFVVDTRARLAWVRCSEGMQWTGSTCSGLPRLLTQAQAQALAVQRWKADGVGWRLPRVPEMRRLVDKSTKEPGLNPRLFPNAPAGWHWSATAHVNANAVNPYAYGTVERGGQGESKVSLVQGWAVDMGTGDASNEFGRGTPLMVRLVRPATAQELPPPPPPKVEPEDDGEDEEE